MTDSASGGPSTPSPDTYLNLPLSAEQLAWVVERAEARDLAPEVFLRYMIRQLKAAEEFARRVDAMEQNTPDSSQDSDANSPSSTTQNDREPPSMFDFLSGSGSSDTH